MRTYTEQDRLKALLKVRAQLEKSETETEHPMPMLSARWLFMQYSRLPGTLVPESMACFNVQPFEALSSQQKVNRLYAEFSQAGSVEDMKALTVPTPWVRWLLGEFDRIGSEGQIIL